MNLKHITRTMLIGLTLLLASCSPPQHERLKISATTWIGYSPLFYAKEKGWLEPLNIKLQHVVSLSENLYLYQSGNADAYVGTQYEYTVLSPSMPSLVPIMLFDRSNGGDIVMSNRSIAELQTAQGQIDVYLEMDSINVTLFKDFIKAYELQDQSFNYINKDQAYIGVLKTDAIQNPTIIVTYVPFNISLKKSGFKEIASTKDNLNLLVVDAMFTTQETLLQHKAQFDALKKLIDRALSALAHDQKEYYETVRPYLLEVSYEEFSDSLDDIVWINKEIDEELLRRINKANFSTRDLL